MGPLHAPGNFRKDGQHFACELFGSHRSEYKPGCMYLYISLNHLRSNCFELKKKRISVSFRVLRGLKYFARSRPAPTKFKPAPTRRKLRNLARSPLRRLLTCTRSTFRSASHAATVWRKTTKKSRNNMSHRWWQFIQWFISKPTKALEKHWNLVKLQCFLRALLKECRLLTKSLNLFFCYMTVYTKHSFTSSASCHNVVVFVARSLRDETPIW